MREVFIPRKLNGSSLVVINQVNEILEEYAGYGFDVMTLRQIYYQLVARDLVENTDQSYKRIGSIIKKARDAGKIDWESIKDTTRGVRGHYHLDDFEDGLKDMARTFRQDLWENQPWWVMVMIEKDALAYVVGKICNDLDIPWTTNRGYPSASHLMRVASQVSSALEAGKKVLILHLGDLDPSGWDMTSDLAFRLGLYSREDPGLVDLGEDDFSWSEDSGLVGFYDHQVIGDPYSQPLLIKRMALNMDQVEQYNPPPNPAKLSDSRVGFYLDKFGRSSWELDALPPPIFKELIEAEFEAVVDQDQWDEDNAEMEREQEALHNLAWIFPSEDIKALAKGVEADQLDAWLTELGLK